MSFLWYIDSAEQFWGAMEATFSRILSDELYYAWELRISNFKPEDSSVYLLQTLLAEGNIVWNFF